MAYTPIVNVDITLNTTGSTREGFGLPLFLAGHDAFEERVRGYTSLSELGEDFTSDSAVYAAAQALWAQTPKVTQLYIGRRNLQYSLAIPTIGSAGDNYTLTVTTNNGVVGSYSATGATSSTAQTILQSLKTSIDTDTTVSPTVTTTLSGTGANAVLLITAKDADVDFARVTTSGTNIVISSTASDSAEQAVKRVEDYTNDWYFIATDERNETFVKAMAAAIQSRTKLFFTATDSTAALSGTNISSATDIGAYLATNKMTRTVLVWHDDAESQYPEMAYIAYGAPYDAGSIAWGNAVLTGIDYSRQPTNNRPLNSTQKAALEARNTNYVDYEGGNSVMRSGKTIGGEWIDIMRGRDWLESDLKSSLRDLLINQKGGKITYDDRGITRVRQVIESSLQRAVNREFLSSFTVTMPKAADIDVADKRARLLQGVKFSGIIAGAILTVNLQGTLSYE